jgi:hypothetical protein
MNEYRWFVKQGTGKRMRLIISRKKFTYMEIYTI